MCAIFSTVFLKLCFGGLSSECHATKCLQRTFVIPLWTWWYTFGTSIFQTFLSLRANVWQQSNWMKKCQRLQLKRCQKNHQESGWKCLQKEVCYALWSDCLFGWENANISQKYAGKVSNLCLFRSWSFFFEKKVLRRWWKDAVRPRSISLAALHKIISCCYKLYGMPTRLGGVSAACNASMHRLFKGHMSRSPQHSVHVCDVHAHVVLKSVFLTSRALVTSILAISFYAIFSLFPAERLKEKR